MFNSKIGIGVLKHPGYNKGKGGGGGGSAAPTTSTSYSTNVPEYARPYVENMLNAAQAQIYTPDMKGFNPYMPYSTNPTDYIAGFSPMQEQAFTSAAGMRVPGQYGMATTGTLGGMAGLAGVESGMGRVGSDYARMATSPGAMSAYMNPYISAALAPQLALANQQYGIAGQEQQSKAAQQGAFGGTREALMSGLNRQNQMLAQNQLIGQGYNKAFDAAQQAQQFGANLGLQGLQGRLAANQAFLGGANQLAGIGGSQLAAQQGIANLQNQFGQQQQGQQQNIINQAVQDYATAQQYPFMQLGLLNSMLRGLPMQQSSTQMYQAAPNPISTIAGLGSAAYGLLGGGGSGTGKKDGGIIKAAGGIPMSRYSNEQLNKVQQSPYSTPLAKVVAGGELGMHNYITANPEAKNIFAQPLQALPQVPPTPMQTAMIPQNRVGLDTIATGDTTDMAGGGIIAFARGETVHEDPNYQAKLDAIANAELPEQDTMGYGRFASLPKQKETPYNPRVGQYGKSKPSDIAMAPEKVLGSNAAANTLFPDYTKQPSVFDLANVSPNVDFTPKAKDEQKITQDKNLGTPAKKSVGEKDELHDTIMGILNEARSRTGSASEAIKEDVAQQRAAMEARNQEAHRRKWLATSAAILQNTSPFWQAGIGSGIEAYGKTDAEIDKQNATDLKDIIAEKGKAQEMDDSANNRLVGVALTALTANENAKLRQLNATIARDQLQSDKDVKNAKMAIDTFEKLRKDYTDNLINAGKVNMDELNKPEILAASYKYASDSLRGSKLEKYLSGVYTDTNAYSQSLGVNQPMVQNQADVNLIGKYLNKK